MKKIKICLCISILAIVFAACGKKETAKDNINSNETLTAYQMAQYIKASQTEMPDMGEFTNGDNNFKDSLDKFYHNIETSKIEDLACLYSHGATAEEITVIKTSNTRMVKEAFEKRIDERKGNFTGYMPKEVATLENAKVVENEEYVALLVCKDGSAAKNAFDDCFDAKKISKIKTTYASQPKKELEAAIAPTKNATKQPTKDPVTKTPQVSPQPGKEMSDLSRAEQPFMVLYDDSRIVKAYKTKDTSYLKDDKEKMVYENAVKVINKVIKKGMSAYDKELAIHDYIVKTYHYDEQALTNKQVPSKDSNMPYGAFKDGNLICTGYANTFQLFMNMLDIKSVVVLGKAYDYSEYHAWNKVYLDGDWYNVDVTWDDPVGGSETEIDHSFFNITDSQMRETDHQWDKNDYPLARGRKYAYNK